MPKKQRPSTDRPEHVHLLLTEIEKQWLLKAAKAHGLTVSGMVRQWIRQEAVGRV